MDSQTGIRRWFASDGKRKMLILRDTSSSGGISSISAVPPITALTVTGATVISTSISSGVLVGRYSGGSGIMEEITIGSGLSLSGGGVLTATGGSGSYDVFYVNLTQVSPNDYTGTASNFTAYSVNAVYFFVFDIVPSGVNAIRVNLNSTSYITIVKPAGGNLPATAITLTTAPYEFAYNGTNFVPESRVKITGEGDALSSITAAIATNSIDSSNYAQTWAWSTASTQTPFTWTANALSTGTLFTLSSTSTAGDESKLLQLTRSGANAGSGKTNYGLYSAITNTGTTSTNVAGYFTASGGSNNYGLVIPNGYFGLGTATPTALAEIQLNAIGATPSDALLLSNTVAAVAGAPQYSPSLHFSGRGFKTSGSSSVSVDFRSYAIPVEGTPIAYLTTESSIDGSAYSTRQSITSTGDYYFNTTPSAITNGNNFILGSSVSGGSNKNNNLVFCGTLNASGGGQTNNILLLGSSGSNNTIAIGYGTSSQGDPSIAIGYNNTSSSQYSVTIGMSSNSGTAGQFVFGRSISTVGGSTSGDATLLGYNYSIVNDYGSCLVFGSGSVDFVLQGTSSKRNLMIGVNPGSSGISGTHTFTLKSGTAPTTVPADSVGYYVQDIAAGQASPHFFTEDSGKFAIGTGKVGWLSNTNLIFVANSSEVLKITTGGAVTINQAYTLPSSDGSPNYILQTNGSGTVSWVAASGTGTVTSIATAGLISGGTITTTGTITTSMATGKLVGRSTAGTGVMEEITVGSGLTLSGGTLSASGGGGGDFVLISSQDASASATIDFTGLSSTYSTYKIIISNMVSSTNNVIPSLRVGTGGTPTYQTGNVYSWIRIYSAGTVVSGNNTSDSKILIGSNGTQSSTATQSHNMEITIVNPSQSTDYHHVYGKSSFIDSAGTFVMQDFVGVYLSTTAVTAIRIYMSSGNIASGKFNLYGIT